MIGLALALGPDNLPVTQFLGGIDTAGYFLALDPTTPSFLSALGLALLAPATVWCLSRPWRPMVKVALVAGVVCLGAAFAWDILRRADEVEPRLVRAVLYLTIEAGYAAILYAPTAAFWAGFGMLWRSRRSWLPLFDLRWLLLAGNLMLLNQYPRLDEIHLLFSAPLLWAIGGYVLYRVHGRFSRSLRATARLALWRPAMFAALLCFPLLIVWPALEPRREDLFVRRTGSPLDITTPRYEPLGLSGASVLEQERFAWRYRVLAGYVDRHVPANERIFVFPAAPLLYYLFDRPNATRFNHIFPGLLSSADERETLERLASPSVNWIAWDTFGAEYWNKDKAYPALTSYIWDNFEPVASAGDIELMRRR
jgi:hypothetical protein